MLTSREKTDVFLWGLVFLGAGVFALASKKKKEIANPEELVSREAAGETLSSDEEIHLQGYIDELSKR